MKWAKFDECVLDVATSDFLLQNYKVTPNQPPNPACLKTTE